MKKKWTYVLVFMLIFSLVSPVLSYGYSKNAVEVAIGASSADINGQSVTLDAPATLVNGRTMVPLGLIAQSAGLEVEWLEAEKKVVVGDQQIILYVGKNEAIVNGETVALDVAPVVQNGRLLVPLRFIAENLGAEVTWHQETKMVTLEISGQLLLAKKLYSQKDPLEETVLNALDSEAAFAFAEEMIKIGSAPEGFRMVGTPEAKEASELIYEKFKEVGLKTEMHEFPAYGWRYKGSSLTLAENPMEIPVAGLLAAPGTPKGGIEAELVFAGNGTKQELAEMDLKGKIALIALDMDYLPWYCQAVTQAEEHGAVGVVYYCENYYGQKEGGDAFAMGDWEGKLATIPALNTPKKYGQELRELLEASGPQKAKLVLDVEINPNAKGYNVIGSIPGSKYPNEYVILNAHTDAYFDGWQDDTIASAALVAIADAMIKSGYKPERTIVFMAFSGEEWGIPDTFFGWLNGSYYYMKDNNAKYAEKTVGSITFESMAWTGTEQMAARASDTLWPFVDSVASSIEAGAYPNSAFKIKNAYSTWSDEWSLGAYGIPTMRTDTDAMYMETLYHSQFDNRENTDIRKYENCLAAYATLTMRMDKVPVMPYDLSATAEKYSDALIPDSYANQQAQFKALETAVNGFRAEASAAFDTSLAITEKLAAAKAEGKDTTQAEKLITDYNKRIWAGTDRLVEGIHYLQCENVAFNTVYYQDLLNSINATMDLLQAGDGTEAMAVFEFPGAYYSEYMDYMPWYNLNSEGFEGSGSKTVWGDKYLEMYDFYKTAESIRAKAAAGETEYADEYKALSVFKTDIENNLKAAVLSDTAVWKAAAAALPEKELIDQILSALQ